MTNLNNFHQYLPGGAYRIGTEDEVPQIMQDLDTILEEQDLEEILLVRDSWLANARQITLSGPVMNTDRASNTSRIDPEATVHGAAAARYKAELNELLQPVYEKMLDLGYTHEQLTD